MPAPLLIGPLWVLTLWPLISELTILAMLAAYLINCMPRMRAQHRCRSPAWLALGSLLLVEAIFALLVIREPASGFPRSLLPTPTATIGLVASAATLFGLVVGDACAVAGASKE